MVRFDGNDVHERHFTDRQSRLQAANKMMIGLFNDVVALLNDQGLISMGLVVADHEGHSDPRVFIQLKDRPEVTFEIQGCRMNSGWQNQLLTCRVLKTEKIAGIDLSNRKICLRDAIEGVIESFSREAVSYTPAGIVKILTAAWPQRRSA